MTADGRDLRAWWKSLDWTTRADLGEWSMSGHIQPSPERARLVVLAARYRLNRRQWLLPLIAPVVVTVGAIVCALVVSDAFFVPLLVLVLLLFAVAVWVALDLRNRLVWAERMNGAVAQDHPPPEPSVVIRAGPSGFAHRVTAMWRGERAPATIERRFGKAFFLPDIPPLPSRAPHHRGYEPLYRLIEAPHDHLADEVLVFEPQPQTSGAERLRRVSSEAGPRRFEPGRIYTLSEVIQGTRPLPGG